MKSTVFFTEIDILETIKEKTKEDKKCEEKVNRFWRQPQQRPCCYQAAAAVQGSQEKKLQLSLQRRGTR